ncbi:hypothetical protein ABZP36_016278 [Zizania latifolia]
MGHSSTDLSVSGHDAPASRRRRGRLRQHRRRSPSPASADPTSRDLSPSLPAASDSPPPSYLPYLDIATASYVVVAPLPVFRGEPGECPDAHLARFDRVNNATSPAAAARIFPASLDGDAALWYDLTAPDAVDSSPPWHAVRTAFLDFFRPPGASDRARAELMSLRQRPGETVNRYHLRMQGILRRFPAGGADVPDAFLKTVFVNGLCAEFQDWVVPQHPEALGEAVALALSWERAESVREARRAVKEAGSRCGFCALEGHDEAQCELRRRMKEFCLRSSSGRGDTATVAEEGGGSMRLARLGSAVSTRSAQCQCRKHQCWKKAVAPARDLAGDGEGSGSAGLDVDK